MLGISRRLERLKNAVLPKTKGFLHKAKNKLDALFDVAVFAFWGILIAVAAVYLVFASFEAKRTNDELLRRKASMSRRLTNAEKKLNSLVKEIDSLKRDPLYVERVLRKEYNMMRDDEILIKQER